MTTLKEKLKELGVLEKFEANLKASNKKHDLDEESMWSGLSAITCNASKLMGAFKWDDTPEGFGFWLGVYLELLHDSEVANL